MADLLVLFVIFVLWRHSRYRARIWALRNRAKARRAHLAKFLRFQDQLMSVFVAHLLCRRSIGCMTKRTVWTKLRYHGFLSQIAERWSDFEWKRNFHISRDTFACLCKELRESLERNRVVREPLSVEQKVAICLWRLGTNVEYRTIGHLFGVGVSTVCNAVHEFCRVIVDTMSAKYITIPNHQQVSRIVDGFSTKWGFPQCIGAIDGTHIPIIAPKENHVDYFNRKGYHSVILQALVDHDYRFLDIYVGWPGSVHDARVLGNSGLYQKGEAGTLLPTCNRMLGNTSVPLVIIGDPAYPLRPWLMKPFSDTGLTTRQRTFNHRLSSARAVVENAFGRLKGRWRCLMKRNDCDVKRIPNIITACCVLHNLCERCGDRCEDEWMVEDLGANMAGGGGGQTSSASVAIQSTGSSIREAFCDYFS